MKKFLKQIFLFILLFSGVSAWAQKFPSPQNPPRLVNDFAGILTSGQRNSLEKKLVDFDRETSTQIAIISVDDLQGLAPSDYSARIFDKWGIGRGRKDNGILILVKPKTANSNGEVFISTGYGLEGAVPDALAGRIVDYDIIPAFREGDYHKGLDQAVNTLMGLTRGEFTGEEYLAKKKRSNSRQALGTLALLFGIVALYLALNRNNRNNSDDNSGNGGNSGGRRSNRPFIPPIIIGGLGGGGGSRGGSFGGGGFGGFGGGRTGGGGAGRSW